jgi:LacI family transcriptional regulator
LPNSKSLGFSEGRLFRAVTMVDVAAAAGVSVATVSRVVSGATSVAPEYHARVAAAVQELGYRPNKLARSLRRQKAEVIGVVVSDIENPHFAEVVHAAETEVFRNGYRMLLCNTDESVEKQQAYLQMLADEHPLGVILVPCDPAGVEIVQLLDLGVPVVAFDRSVRDDRADAIVPDNVEASKVAVHHLVEGGYRRIGFLGIAGRLETGAARLAGYKSAMAAAGLDACWEDGGLRVDTGVSATERLLERWPEVDGLIAANSMMAMGALHVLRARGLRVPDDVGIVAFDDPGWAELVDPPLTTLAQPIRAMVASAVRVLLDRIDARPGPPQHLTFGLELRVRESSRRRLPSSLGADQKEPTSPWGAKETND